MWYGRLIPVIAVIVPALASQERRDIAFRTVGTHQGHEIAVTLPLSRVSLVETLIVRAAAAAAVPVGIELVADDALPSGVVLLRRNPQRVVLTGRPLAEALDLAVTQALAIAGSREEYMLSWKEDGGIIHVRSFRRSKSSFLDSVVGTFEVTDMPLRQVLAAVHRLVNPTFGGRAHDTSSIRIGINGAGGLATDVIAPPSAFPRVTVRRNTATVRDVLDAVVLAAGQYSWIVRFADSKCEYGGSQIILAGFDGVYLGTQAGR